MRCSPLQFKMLHAVMGDISRAYPAWSTAQWKAYLITIFPAFLAEANGDPIPPPAPRESTLEMDGPRMNELIEMCLWLGAEIGVEFRDDDK